MIPLTRTRNATDVPAVLRDPTRQVRELHLIKFRYAWLRKGKVGKWKSDYWKFGKDLLKRESNEKCAYCESPTSVVAHGDVEHFRPKASYWWLAFCLDNHLYACQICNQTYKKDKFPLEAGGVKFEGPKLDSITIASARKKLVNTFAPDPVGIGVGYTLATYLAACAAEKPELPDPYIGDPSRHFKWLADANEKVVWIKARSPQSQFVLDAVEDALGLNRDELLKARWTLAYKHLENYREELAEIDKNRRGAKARKTACARINEMMADDQPYAGMVRYFVKEAWKLKL